MMDAGTFIAVGTAIAGAAGGYWGGKQTVSIQSAALEALQMRVEDQQRTIATIPDLQAEIRVLQELVTQRANVEKVIQIVERTEGKIDGLVHQAGHDGSE